MADNLYAGSSVQVYADSSWLNLERTHEDARGFLDYVAQFNAPNFRITDDDVAQWRFDPVFDDAQGWRGADSVTAYYHSGHGAMDSAGVFEMPMGSTWATRMSAFSNGMRIGDQKLRYLFLSTCDSVRVMLGDNPWRTWNGANTGCRMIFGYSSLSEDWGGYGREFFRRWNTGVSFSQAWQDTSVGHTFQQVVSSTACGATAEEAQDRLWNERFFNGGRVSDSWYWWRWTGVPPEVAVEVKLGIGVPRVPRHFRAALRRADRAAMLAELFGLRLVEVEAADPGGRESGPLPEQIVHSDDDSISVLLAPVDPDVDRVSFEELRQAADGIAGQLDPEGRLDLVFDRFTGSYHAGASDGEVIDADAADFTAHYRQRFEGVPAVMGDAGHVAITLDRAGRPCRIIDRAVDVLAAEHAAAPPEPEGATAELDVRGLLEEVQRRRFDPCGDRRLEFDPDADEVGYRFRDGEGVLVARRVVTLESGGMRKAHLIEVPIGSRAGVGAGQEQSGEAA
jgi:hypothetical protein